MAGPMGDAMLHTYDGAMHCAFKFLERYPDQVEEARFQLQLASSIEGQLTGELSKGQKLRVQLVNVAMFLADSMPNVADRRDEISAAFLGCVPKKYNRVRCDELHSALTAQMDAIIKATSSVNQATARTAHEDFGRTKDYQDMASDIVQFLRPIMRKLPGPSLAKSLEDDASNTNANTNSDNVDTGEKGKKAASESASSASSESESEGGMQESLNVVFCRSVLKQYATDMLSHEEGAWNRITKGAVGEFEEEENDDDDDVASPVPTRKASKKKPRSTASSSATTSAGARASTVASLGIKLAGAAAVADNIEDPLAQCLAEAEASKQKEGDQENTPPSTTVSTAVVATAAARKKSWAWYEKDPEATEQPTWEDTDGDGDRVSQDSNEAGNEAGSDTGACHTARTVRNHNQNTTPQALKRKAPRLNQSPVRGGKRKKWTATETETLYQLVTKYGSGKWSDMKGDIGLGHILVDRSDIQLKDKWRNITNAKERMGE